MSLCAGYFGDGVEGERNIEREKETALAIGRYEEPIKLTTVSRIDVLDCRNEVATCAFEEEEKEGGNIGTLNRRTWKVHVSFVWTYSKHNCFPFWEISAAKRPSRCQQKISK